MKYTEIRPNIKWNCPVDSNLNVLVLSHIQQLQYYIPPIKEHIWEKFADVTIWQINSQTEDINQLLLEIFSMDAVICFVTELLISTDNIVGKILLPKILESKIPLLPIADGKNIEVLFDKKYGHFHMIKNQEMDILPYEAIWTFIEHLPRVKKNKDYRYQFEIKAANSFSEAYFISYRKTDGKYIDYLLSMIHENSSFVDTQLWYDSYLKPGKDYDESLKKIIEKCSLVVLLVTPKLLEKNNYVMRVEIPYAQKCGKPIIGLMMEDTPLDKIKYLYNVEKIYDLKKWKNLNEILKDAEIAIPKINKYSDHIFSLAINYMYGNDTEINVNVAIELLYQCIKYSHEAAFEKLIEILTGEYELNKSATYKNYSEAERIFEKYIEILENNYIEDNKDEKKFIKLINYMKKRGEYNYQEGMLNESIAYLQRLNDVIFKEVNMRYINRYYSYISIINLIMARIYNNLKDYEKANIYYKKSVNYDRALNNNDINAVSFTNLLVSLYEYADFCQKQQKLLKAKFLYQEILETIKNTGTAYSLEWDEDRVHIGYENDDVCKTVAEAEYSALVRLTKNEIELREQGIFNPTKVIYSRIMISDKSILEICNEDEVELFSHEIMMNSIDKVIWLSKYVSKLDWDVDICQGRFCIDAKSVGALVDMVDMSDTCQVVVHTLEYEQAKSILYEIVYKLNVEIW